MRTAGRDLSPERLACVDESLLKYLGVLSSRHPERFVAEPPLSKLCDVASFVSREVVVARLERLEFVRRLIPAKCGQQTG